MKLRYYMRGLGIGILVTTILMTVTLNGKTEKLSDAEIIERAEALGMEQKYDSTVLADTVSENEAEEEEIVPQEIVTDTEEEISEELPAEDAEEAVPDEDVSEPENETEEEQQVSEPESTENVQITVQGGDGSQTVARKLAEAGLVDDAVAYDKYLCANGYDKKICTGTHIIPVGASEEEIAKIITSRP